MRAWVPDSGRDERIALAWVEPPFPAADEVVVAVDAYSVNRGETLLLARPRAGWRPGKDVAGTVVAPAPNGRGPGVGARVVAHPPEGGWAEQVAVPVADLSELPDSISTVEAAALPLAGLTALRLVRAAGPLAGRRVLLTGASGGVGHYVVELARAAGAEVTAVSASPERGARLLALGAHEVVTDVGDSTAAYDVVLESVGGRSFASAVRALRPDGLLLWFGQASGEAPALDFFDYFDPPIRLRLQHFDYTQGPATYGADLRLLVDLVASGRLHPEIGMVRPWRETPTVLRELTSRRVRGNAVLTVGPTAPPRAEHQGEEHHDPVHPVDPAHPVHPAQPDDADRADRADPGRRALLRRRAATR